MQITKTCNTIICGVLFLTLIAFLGSCRCNGCDEVYDVAGINITTATDSVVLAANNKADVLYFNAVMSQHSGNRKCMVKTLAICPAATVKTDEISVISDKALVYGSQTFAPQTNLWQATSFIEKAITVNDGFGFHALLTLNAPASFQPGLYHFYFSAKTTDGKEFRDTASIVYY